jgi:hypothetical protein
VDAAVDSLLDVTTGGLIWNDRLLWKDSGNCLQLKHFFLALSIWGRLIIWGKDSVQIDHGEYVRVDYCCDF